jgi:hypothetical protein
VRDKMCRLVRRVAARRGTYLGGSCSTGSRQLLLQCACFDSDLKRLSDPVNTSERQQNSMATARVAVWGCGHGELDRVYDVVRELNARAPDGRAIELLICCGDFEAVRNPADLECMACPPKYRHMGSFHRYYSGAAVAPVLTLFIGGNHEAANYNQELFYGGWAAPNIFYLGNSGVVSFRGLRIAGACGCRRGGDAAVGGPRRCRMANDARRPSPGSVGHCRRSPQASRASSSATTTVRATTSGRRTPRTSCAPFSTCASSTT